MFFWVIIILFILLIAEEIFFLKRLKGGYARRKEDLTKQYELLQEQEKNFKQEMGSMEGSLSKQFLFYDLTRRITPFLTKKELFDVFMEEVKHLGEIEDIGFYDEPKAEGYLKFDLGNGNAQSLYLKTLSKTVLAHIPYFVNLLKLCLERIGLYDKLQELSITDSLTKIHNRRYFMLRFAEEFERAKKFNLSLSFLMIDIDFFKKTNDTYGHLAGDAVLKEIARMIRESVREIDFAARYGGEEFSVILSETDKAGAIMVAERINSKISREQVKVFDEVITANVSIGVASFPQNALHLDVLMETADKALYKAKLSGRNRVCWF